MKAVILRHIQAFMQTALYAGTAEGEGLVNELTTPDDGLIIVKGVQQGKYSLTETEAPNGYNKLTADVEVEATQTGKTTTFTTTYLDKDGNVVAEKTEDGSTVTVSIEKISAGSVVVVNKTGAELPATGGIGVMGYIKIPKIDVFLPIYHGTEENVLQTSIGHLEESSLPVGGESAHSMLSGHRGLPSARLFTDLDKLGEGDTFTMTILNETLTYEVDHIWIVEPSDLSHLTIEDGKDYCTLITCTPYGINTHRLLVRAHRIENVNGNAMVVADAIQIRPVYIAPFLAVPILLVLLIYVLFSTSARSRKKRDLKEEYLNENGLHEEELEIDDRDIGIEAVKSFMEKRRK